MNTVYVYQQEKVEKGYDPSFDLVVNFPSIGREKIDIGTLETEKLGKLEEILSKQISSADYTIYDQYLNSLANLAPTRISRLNTKTMTEQIIEEGGKYDQRDTTFQKYDQLGRMLRVVNTGSFFIHGYGVDSNQDRYVNKIANDILGEALAHAIELSSKSGHSRGWHILDYLAKNPQKRELLTDEHKTLLPGFFLRDYCDRLYNCLTGVSRAQLSSDDFQRARFIVKSLGFTEKMLKDSFETHPHEHSKQSLEQGYFDYLRAIQESTE